MKSELKTKVILATNKTHMKVLEDITDPTVLHARVPRLGEVAEARAQHKARMDTIRELGQYKNANLAFVAQIDQSIWSVVLSIFARHDPDTGQPLDDGLLYKYDPRSGTDVLNKDFFFALLSGPLKGYDFRHKKVLM